MYKLKGESFSIVDGPDAGKKFIHGKKYPTVPEGYLSRFELITAAAAEITASAPAEKSEDAAAGFSTKRNDNRKIYKNKEEN